MFRQPDGQLILWYRNHTVNWTIDDWNWCPPVTFPSNQPVAQPVGDHKRADASILQVPGNFSNRLAGRRAIERARVNHYPQVFFCLRPGRGIARCLTLWSDNLAYGNAELTRKFEIALVMAGHTHDGTRAVAHQYIISDPNRNLLAVEGIGDIAACKDACLLLLRAHTLDLGHMPCLVHVGLDFGFVFRRRDLLDPGMLGRQHEERDSEDSIRARGEDGDLFPLSIDLGEETNLCPFAATDPVALHGHCLIRPLDLGEVQQFFCIVGDSHQPLVDLFADYHAAATFTGTIRQHLLVCQRRITTWTPVSRGLGAIGQPMLI